jgi:hypothetical protein
MMNRPPANVGVFALMAFLLTPAAIAEMGGKSPVKVFILAGNGIESARLCLLSSCETHPNGLGNGAEWWAET